MASVAHFNLAHLFERERPIRVVKRGLCDGLAGFVYLAIAGRAACLATDPAERPGIRLGRRVA